MSMLSSGAGLQTIGVTIRGDATSLLSSLAKSAVGVDAFEKSTKDTAKRISGAWKIGMAAAAVTVLALVAGLTSAGVAAAGFEVRMRNVNSLVKATDGEFRALSGSVLDLATKLPTGANDLADGLYQIASSGFAGAEGLLVLDAAATAASAGLSSTENAVTAITAVLNSYGLSASSSKDVSDALFQTVNLGVIEFDQLTGVIGDVVGMAAAAKVPIEDVGAAIATMTLSGISGSEAGTSLNRLLQSLIQPSEALAATYKKLGIESGATALETMGLSGVMEMLRTATGGSVESMLQLFPQVRAARGAFALAADEGKTYAGVQAQIGDDSIRLGSTQEVLAEQMKAAKNQWKVFTNTLESNAIALGTQVLPAAVAVLGVMQSLAADAVPALNSGLAVVAPLMSTLYDLGVNVVQILEALIDTALPVAGALASMVAGATLAGLTVLAESLAAVTGFLADHPALIVAVAALWASRYLPSITAVSTGLRRYATAAKTSATSSMGYVREQIRYQQVLAAGSAANTRSMMTGTGQISNLRAGMAAATTTARGLGAALVASGIATAGLAIGISMVVYAAQTGADDIKAAVAEITDGLTEFNGPSAEEAMAGLIKIRDELEATGAKQDAGFWKSYLKQYQNDGQLLATSEAIGALAEKVGNTKANLNELARATGLTVEELTKLQNTQNVDLTSDKNTADAQAGRDQIVAYVKDIEKQANLSSDAMTGAVGNDIEAWQALSDAIDTATSKAVTSFASSTDVLGGWKPDIGVKEHEDSLVRLTDAQDALTEAQDESRKSAERQSGNTPEQKADAAESSAKRILTAEENLADAEAGVQDAAAKQAAGTLEATYQASIDLGRQFSQDLTTAVEMGLDPAIVARLLAEGPEQAAPILAQLVGDHSGNMIEMVNASEEAISAISAQVAEQARLTAIAVNATTDQMAKDLPTALKISAMAWDGSTAKDIADELGLKPEDVRTIAQEFGITIATGIQWGLDSIGAPRIATGLGGAGGQVPGAASGGIYPGYTPGRDIGYIGISGGEAIMRPEWTRAVGPGFVHKMNAIARTGGISAVQAAMGKYMGGFAGGGVAGAYQGQPSAQVITVPVSSTNERYSPVSIARAYFTDPAAAGPYADRTRAQRNTFGG